jgi:hypothetical protein
VSAGPSLTIMTGVDDNVRRRKDDYKDTIPGSGRPRLQHRHRHDRRQLREGLSDVYNNNDAKQDVVRLYAGVQF